MNNIQIPNNVPIIGNHDQPVMLPVVVQITADLIEKLAELVKTRGIDGVTLVAEIVSRGLASIYAELRDKHVPSASEEPRTRPHLIP